MEIGGGGRKRGTGNKSSNNTIRTYGGKTRSSKLNNPESDEAKIDDYDDDNSVEAIGSESHKEQSILQLEEIVNRELKSMGFEEEELISYDEKVQILKILKESQETAEQEKLHGTSFSNPSSSTDCVLLADYDIEPSASCKSSYRIPKKSSVIESQKNTTSSSISNVRDGLRSRVLDKSSSLDKESPLPNLEMSVVNSNQQTVKPFEVTNSESKNSSPNKSIYDISFPYPKEIPLKTRLRIKRDLIFGLPNDLESLDDESKRKLIENYIKEQQAQLCRITKPRSIFERKSWRRIGCMSESQSRAFWREIKSRKDQLNVEDSANSKDVDNSNLPSVSKTQLHEETPELRTGDIHIPEREKLPSRLSRNRLKRHSEEESTSNAWLSKPENKEPNCKIANRRKLYNSKMLEPSQGASPMQVLKNSETSKEGYIKTFRAHHEHEIDAKRRKNEDSSQDRGPSFSDVISID